MSQSSSSETSSAPSGVAAGRPLDAIVLAAGLGTRMRSDVVKVLHRLCGRPMVEYPLRLLAPLGVRSTVLVLGHQADAVEKTLRAGSLAIPDLRIALQAEPRGTADAVRSALPQLPDDAGRVLILYGDTPLLTQERLRALCQAGEGVTLALLTTRLDDPTGYGRVLCSADGMPERIVEEKDCTPEQRKLQLVNAGMYSVDAAFLRQALLEVRENNAQRELYLTDLLALARAHGTSVAAVEAHPEEVQGVNDRVDLSHAETILRRRINTAHLRRGVTLRDPASTYIDDAVEIERDTELGPGVVLRGKTRIGARCVIEAGCVLTDVVVGDGCHLKPYTVAGESRIERDAQLGPFSHLRPGSELCEGAHVGNFVELKKTRLGRGSKANHLAYLGDSEIGTGVNVGCGTITCNYDGVSKHQTIIEDGVFIGSDTQLVAPVRVGKNAIIAAGTTVTRNVPPDSLTLSRAPQVDKPGYAETLRTRLRAAKKSS